MLHDKHNNEKEYDNTKIVLLKRSMHNRIKTITVLDLTKIRSKKTTMVW